MMKEHLHKQGIYNKECHWMHSKNSDPQIQNDAETLIQTRHLHLHKHATIEVKHECSIAYVSNSITVISKRQHFCQ